MKSVLPIYSLFGLLFVLTTPLQAQLPRFTQYREYRSVINPAALESHYLQYDQHYNLSFGISYRNEGVSGEVQTPNTKLGRISWIPEIGNRFRPVIGGYVLQDQFGPTKFLQAAVRLAAFSYDSSSGNLSAGFNLGVNQFRQDLSEESFFAPGDKVLTNALQQTYLNLGLGIYYSRRMNVHDWYVGFSIPQLFDVDRTIHSSEGGYPFIFSPQYYGLVGIHYYVGKYAYWEPSLWIKYLPNENLYFEQNTYHADFNIRYHFVQPKIWAGVGLSTQRTIHTEIGVDFGTMHKGNQALRIGLGYDFSSGSLSNSMNHSFELNAVVLLHR